MSTTKKKPAAKKSNGNDAGAKHSMEVENIGPIHRFAFEVYPGVNEVCGGQEAGKTLLTNAIASKIGIGVPVEVSEGETEGSIRLDGNVWAEFKRGKGKQPYVSLGSASPVALVVDPRTKGPESAEEIRLRNLVLISGLKTTRETIHSFLTLEPADEEAEPLLDEVAFDYVEDEYGVDKLITLDPVAAADVLVKGAGGLLHKLRRVSQKEGDQWEAKYVPPATVVVSDLEVEDAQIQYEKAVGDHRQLSGEWDQRQKREAERAEIGAIGERPSVEMAEAYVRGGEELVNQTQVKCESIAGEIRVLQERLEGAKVELAERKDGLTDRLSALARTRDNAEAWDRRKAILDSEITGAAAEDVETAAAGVLAARAALELARQAEAYQQQLATAEEAKTKMKDSRDREKEVARLADAVPLRLGELFAEAGIPGARVFNGEFQIKKGKDWRPFQTHFSGGDKWRFVLPIWAKHNPDGQLVLVKEAWGELELESKQEIAEIFAENNVVAYVEVTTFRDDPLHVRRFEATAEKAGEVATIISAKARRQT